SGRRSSRSARRPAASAVRPRRAGSRTLPGSRRCRRRPRCARTPTRPHAGGRPGRRRRRRPRESAANRRARREACPARAGGYPARAGPASAKRMDRALDSNVADLASVTDEIAAQPGVAELAGALDSALPARVRVPEAALAPLLAALWRRRRGDERAGLALLVDDDDTAREIADEAAWYAPADLVGFVPSHGVPYGSGLQPAPHLVGERARGLGLLAAGGVVAISAAALVERIPPGERRA